MFSRLLGADPAWHGRLLSSQSAQPAAAKAAAAALAALAQAATQTALAALAAAAMVALNGNLLDWTAMLAGVRRGGGTTLN